MTGEKSIKIVLVVLGIIAVLTLWYVYSSPFNPDDVRHTPEVKHQHSDSLVMFDIDSIIPKYLVTPDIPDKFRLNLSLPYNVVDYDGNGTWSMEYSDLYSGRSYNCTYNPYGIEYIGVDYTPDVVIANGTLSFDIGILDITGDDFVDVPLTAMIIEKNVHGDILSNETQTVMLDRLNDTEYREIRLAASLPNPNVKGQVSVAVTVSTPTDLMQSDGSHFSQGQASHYQPSGHATFNIVVA
ncbi:MAG TPA: hypothetical protein VK436_13360 [Methanocella sp.]|nr:hypothetical protein [Methanocella sp.]